MCKFMGTGQADSFYVQGFDFGVWEGVGFLLRIGLLRYGQLCIFILWSWVL